MMFQSSFTFYELTLYAITFVYLALASLSDLKTREVPDWLNYGAIICGIAINLLWSIITQDFSFIGASILGLLSMVAFAYGLFYTGQWGGGDSKALMAVGALFGISLNQGIPFLILFLLALAAGGALYGMVWSIVLGFIHYKEVGVCIAELSKKKYVLFIKLLILAGLLCAAVITVTPVLWPVKLFVISTSLGGGLFFCLWLFVSSVEKTCLRKTVGVEKLTEGDWILSDIIAKATVLFKKSKAKLTRRQVTKIHALCAQYDFTVSVRRNFLYIKKELRIPLREIKKNDVLTAPFRNKYLKLPAGQKLTWKLVEDIAFFLNRFNLKPVSIRRQFLGFWYHRKIHPRMLAAGDILNFDVVVCHYICGPRDLGISKSQIAQLKKLNIREVAIKEGIPFIPSFLLGFIIAVLLRNVWGGFL